MTLIERVIRSAGSNYTIDDDLPRAFLYGELFRRGLELLRGIVNVSADSVSWEVCTNPIHAESPPRAAVLDRCRVHCRCERFARREIGPRRKDRPAPDRDDDESTREAWRRPHPWSVQWTR